MKRKSPWLTGSALVLLGVGPAYAQSAPSAIIGFGPPIVVAGECNGAGAAGEIAMVLGFNEIMQQLEQMGAEIAAGQNAQNSAKAQIFQQVNTNFANAEREAAVAQMQDKITATQPVDQNGNSIRQDCGMTGASGGALGAVAGHLARAGYSAMLLNELRTADAGSQDETQSYITALASTQVDPASVIGGPTGTGTSSSGTGTYDAENVGIAIQQLTNPLPSPALPTKVVSTPNGQKYLALTNVQQAALGLSQETLAGIAALNAPIYPLESWASGQIAAATAGNSTLQSQETAALSAASDNGAISDNTFMATMDQLKFGNPTWWQTIATTPSSAYLLQQINETDAMDLNASYQTMVLKERIDAMMAVQSAQEISNTIGQAASAVRNAAIEEGVGGSSAQ
jgi:hypothetical protein